MAIRDSNLYERVAKVEANVHTISETLADIKQTIRDTAEQTKQAIRDLAERMDGMGRDLTSRMDQGFRDLAMRDQETNLRIDKLILWGCSTILGSFIALSAQLWLKR